MGGLVCIYTGDVILDSFSRLPSTLSLEVVCKKLHSLPDLIVWWALSTFR